MKKSNLKRPIITTAVLGLFVSMSACTSNDESFTVAPEPQRPTPETVQATKLTFENITPLKDFIKSGEIPAVAPGVSVSIKFAAGNTQYLSFISKYVNSNDWFFAPDNPGLKLYTDTGEPITGNVTDQLKLWDNGTRDNSTNEAESNTTQEVSNVDVSKLVKLDLAYDEVLSEFTLTITNTSNTTENETALSQGAWAISNTNGNNLLNIAPFFTTNENATTETTEVAENGDTTSLLAKLEQNTGIITLVAKAVVVTFTGDVNPIYTLNTLDRGQGLKELSQKGETELLEEALKSVPNVTGIYVTDKEFAPGENQKLNFDLNPGESYTFAAMFAFSSDWFFSPNQPLTSANSNSTFTDINIFSSGTGVNQFPGAGHRQALFGGTPEPTSLPVAVVNPSNFKTLQPASYYLKLTVE